MKKLFTAAAICLAVLFTACDQPTGGGGGRGGGSRTTLTIRNESAHEVTHVIWNNVLFTTGVESINPGASVTMDVQAGNGFVRFRPRSNFLGLRTQQLLTVPEGEQVELVILGSTIVLNESDNSTGTFDAAAAAAPLFINWAPAAIGSPTTTAITFYFTSDPGQLSASNFEIISDTGSATIGTLSGSGTMRTLTVSEVSAGYVFIIINHDVVSSAPQPLMLSAPGVPTITINIMGIPPVYNSRDAQVVIALYYFDYNNLDEVYAHGIITNGTLTVRFPSMPSDLYFVGVVIDDPIRGWVIYMEIDPRFLFVGNNNVPFSGFIHEDDWDDDWD